MATPKASDKNKPHKVLSRLKYMSHTEKMRYIDPDPKKKDEEWKKENITFDHLDDAGYLKLRRKRSITPLA